MDEDTRPTFRIDLFQTVPEHEVLSETFTVTADSEDEALEKAKQFVEDEKDLDVPYHLELHPEEEAADQVGEGTPGESDNQPASSS